MVRYLSIVILSFFKIFFMTKTVAIPLYTLRPLLDHHSQSYGLRAGSSLTIMDPCPHPSGMRSRFHGFSHGLTNSPPDCLFHQSADWCRPFKSLFPDIKKDPHRTVWVFFMAEKEGFEPSKPFWGLHDFQSCALGQLRDFSKWRRSIDLLIIHQHPRFVNTFFQKIQIIFYRI